MARDRLSIRTTEPTRYEVILERGEERRTVGYTARRSRPGLYPFVRDVAAFVLAELGEDEDTPMTKTRGSVTFGTGWVLRFSGRTEREVAGAGDEYPGLDA